MGLFFKKKKEIEKKAIPTFEESVKLNHMMFVGIINPRACGRIHIYGKEEFHQTFEVLMHEEEQQFRETAEIINENPSIYAISITLFRNRADLYGRMYSVKETLVINKNYSKAIIYESKVVGNKEGMPVYSNELQEIEKPFSDVSNLTHDILDAFGIIY